MELQKIKIDTGKIATVAKFFLVIMITSVTGGFSGAALLYLLTTSYRQETTVRTEVADYDNDDELFDDLNDIMGKRPHAEGDRTQRSSATDGVKEEDFTAEDLARVFYVKKYVKVAMAEKKIYGIPICITLSQGLLESKHGESKLAKKNNNHFGIKCFSRTCGKGHCTNHYDDGHKDFFRKYESVWGSFRDHSKFLQKERYKSRTDKCGNNDYKCWAQALQEGGYATDPRYAKKLIRLIERYKLYKYDQQ